MFLMDNSLPGMDHEGTPSEIRYFDVIFFFFFQIMNQTDLENSVW